MANTFIAWVLCLRGLFFGVFDLLQARTFLLLGSLLVLFLLKELEPGLDDSGTLGVTEEVDGFSWLACVSLEAMEGDCAAFCALCGLLVVFFTCRLFPCTILLVERWTGFLFFSDPHPLKRRQLLEQG